MGRDIGIDYLRSFVNMSVVAHHAALAYTTFSRFDPAHYLESSAPVVDTVRFSLLDILVGWNDIFFMSLMFFISGLFVAPSIARKGPGRFLADRLKRLGIPFIGAAVLVSPIAFYPSWLLSDHTGRSGFLDSFFAGGCWNSGPLWFIWVLIAFCLVVAAAFRIFPGLMKKLSWTAGSPAGLTAVFLAATLTTAVPAKLLPWPDSIGLIGPLGLAHPSRGLLYFIWFLLGVALGGADMGRSLSRENLRPWPLWLAIGASGYLVNGLSEMYSTAMSPYASNVLQITSFALCCVFTNLAALGIARRFFRAARSVFDNLSDNAYGIYIFHYAFVTWAQYMLVGQPLPALVKFLISFLIGLAGSWALTALLSRTPAGRVL